jgi:glycosyltransferase involved in cell wall biosynthesis
LLCRPFFKNVVLHWHAAGLAKWLETSVQIRTRAMTYRLFRPVNLSIVLSRHNFADAQKLLSHTIRIVNNGIADPCADFAIAVRSRREARARMRLMAGQQLEPAENRRAGDEPYIVKVLFLAHCMREKGLFDALEGVAMANEMLKKTDTRLRLQLTVAGAFVNPREQAEFTQRVIQLATASFAPTIVNYLGFVSGEKKSRVFLESDIFLFPSYYHAESFGLVVVEAMAFGLPIVTTRWRSIPELFPANYPGLVDIQSPAQIASALIQLATGDHNWSSELRDIFQKKFTIQQHLVALAAALHGLEADAAPRQESP